jgi:3-deoxy-D-manno-octulosonic-acid transferase
MLIRLIKKAESVLSILQKLTIQQENRPDKHVIWFHAASVGEVNIAIPLVKKILSERSDVHCLVTTITQTSAKIFKSANIVGATHQFLPLDISFIISNFLEHWNPKVAIFIESELWPNIIDQTAKKIPILLFNARLSDASYKNWNRCKKFASKLFKKFTIIFPASKLDYDRFSNFTKGNLKFIGHFKYSSPALSYSEDFVALLNQKLKNKSVFLVVSTHKGEEKIIFDVHQKLKKQTHNLFTIIIPRHPNRIEEVKAGAQQHKFDFITDIEDFKEDDEMLLIGAFGILGNYFQAIDIVFIGGSLIDNIGGHNILEPAKLSTAIIVGPYTSNFKDTVDEFKQQSAICIVNNQQELEDELLDLLQNSERRKKMMINAKNISEKYSDVSEVAIGTIYKYIS